MDKCFFTHWETEKTSTNVFRNYGKFNHGLAFQSLCSRASSKPPPWENVSVSGKKLTVLTTNFPSLLHRLQPISILPSSCLKIKPKPAHPKMPRLPAFANPWGSCLSPLWLLKRSLCFLTALLSLREVQWLWCPISTTAAGLGTVAAALHPTPRHCSCCRSSWMKSSALLLGCPLSCRIFSAPFQEILALLRGRDLS